MLAKRSNGLAVRVAVAVAVVAGGLVAPAIGQVAFDGGSATTPTYLATPSNWVGPTAPGATGEGVLDNSVITLPGTLHFGSGMSIGSLNINSPTLNEVLSSPNAGALLNVSFGGATRDGAALPLVTVGADAPDAVRVGDTASQGINFILTQPSGRFHVTEEQQNLTIKASLINKSGVTASIEKTGAGTLTLVRPDTALSANGSTFGGVGGTVTVTEGTLSVSDNNNLGNTNNKVVLNGGTFQYRNDAATASASTARGFVVQESGTINVTLPSPWSYTITGVLAGSGTLTKTGASELILNNAAGTFNGTIAVGQGSVRLLNPASVAAGTTVKLVGLNSTLNLRRDNGGTYPVNVDATTANGQVYVDRQSGTGGAFTIGDVTLGAVTLNLNGNAANNNSLAVGNVTLVGDGATIQASFIPVTVNGAVGESGGSYGLKKMGPATLTLTQASTFTGGVNVGGGALEISSDAQLGAGAAAAVTVATDYTPTTPSPAVLKVTGSFVSNRPVAAGDGTIDNAQDATFGAVTGSGVLIKAGAGKLTVPSIVGGALSVGEGEVELAAGGGTSRLAGFAYGTGHLDVTNNRLVLAQQAEASVRGWLAGGAVVSSAASELTGIGYLTVGASGKDVSTWGALDVVAGDVVTMLTYKGDIDLDGDVDRDDLAQMDRGLASSVAGSAVWFNGDVNYDGSVTSVDYLLADRAFAAGGGALTPDFLAARAGQFGNDYVSQLVAAVPEPTGAGLLAAAASALSLRRRRK